MPSFRRSSLLPLTLWLFAQPLAAPAQSNYATPYSFVTVAGAMSAGSTDGPLDVARFYAPVAAAADAAGNLYILDGGNHTIRKLDPDRIVSTLAGSAGYVGSIDGEGAAARFHAPQDLAIDEAGNLYVADTGNHTIRRITPAGRVTTLAGSPGLSGAADGVGSQARFNEPRALTVARDGTVYVADTLNHAIRKITPTGQVTTLAGALGVPGKADGAGAIARFDHPHEVEVSVGGDLYVSDNVNNRICRLNPAGEVTTFVTGRAANGLLIDAAGNLYVTQHGFALYRISPDGTSKIFAGDPYTAGSEDGTGTAARFGNMEYQGPGIPPAVDLFRLTPWTLGHPALDRNGDLLVPDVRNNTLRRVTRDGVVSLVAGYPAPMRRRSIDGFGDRAHFGLLAQLAAGADGVVYVADPEFSVIRRISGSVVTTFAGSANEFGLADGTGAAARFNQPMGVAVDHAGTIYVADTLNGEIRRITSTGEVSTYFITGGPGVKGTNGRKPAFQYPHRIAVDAAGNLFVAEISRIWKVAPGGAASQLPGSEGRYDPPEKPFGLAYLETIEGLALDSVGNLYATYVTHALTSHAVALPQTSTIRRFSPEGAVSLATGATKLIGDADGPASQATFNRLRGIAVDASGNIFLADYFNQTIRRLSPDGQVTTVAGLTDTIGDANGIGSAVRFHYPTAVAVDRTGALYVANDTSIRKGRLATAPVITLQPQSLTVAPGASVTFSVAAEGTPDPTYLWYFNGNPFVGATSNSLSFANVRASDAGDYTVVVTNDLGSVTSTKATLTVKTVASPPTSGGGSANSGGGGGAPSVWFVLTLLWLGMARRCHRGETRKARNSS